MKFLGGGESADCDHQGDVEHGGSDDAAHANVVLKNSHNFIL